jgi:hypothetical protein
MLPMIRFACPSCGMAVSAPEDCAGRRTKCHRCNGLIIVPNIAAIRTSPDPVIPRTISAPSPRTSAPETLAWEGTPQSRSAAERVAPFFASALALAIFGFAGWLLWKFSSPPFAEPTSGKQFAKAVPFSPKQEKASAKAPSEPRREKARSFPAQKIDTPTPEKNHPNRRERRQFLKLGHH